MSRLSTEQQNQINEAARRLVGDFGIERLDNIPDEDERGRALRDLYRKLREETGTTYDTSRKKIALACRRARHPDRK